MVEEHKFWGVIYDKKIHLCPSKTLQLLRVTAHKDWGTNKRTIICPKLDYGCMICGLARRTYLKPLDTIHHEGIRLALGAFSTSPIESLYVEVNEPSLKLRREKLALQHYLKLKSCPSNPAYNSTLNSKCKQKRIQ